MTTRLLAMLAALQAANQTTIQDKLVDALVSAAVGAIVAIAAFRSRLDRHTDALKVVKDQREEDRRTDKDQRAEDRAEDRASREAIATTFREMCANLDRSRAQEMAFLQRQVEQFRLDLKMSERRQLHMLDLQSAIARKLDIRHRLTDAMVTPDDDEPGRG